MNIPFKSEIKIFNNIKQIALFFNEIIFYPISCVFFSHFFLNLKFIV